MDAPKKVLFILKEPGAPGDGYTSLQDLFTVKWNREARHSFINLGRWAYAIHNFPGTTEFAKADNKVNRDLAFISSAVINLRKEPSDRKDRSCDEERLSKTVRDNAEALRNQIKDIAPDIIVCCGGSVFDHAKKIRNTESYKLLNMCHPSARGTAVSKYEKLQKALGECDG